VLESNDFHPGRSGRNHLRVLALAAGLPFSRVEEVLDVVELAAAAGRPVKSYSLGMRQRLGLAAALLGEPELLILDEPINGLDPAGVHWLRTFLRGFAARGGTVLVSSHVLAEVAQTVDRVLIIDNGRLLADATVDELARHGQSLEAAYLELTTADAS
jgi:ABC-2 type transport system ATP-binding protein